MPVKKEHVDMWTGNLETFEKIQNETIKQRMCKKTNGH